MEVRRARGGGRGFYDKLGKDEGAVGSVARGLRHLTALQTLYLKLVESEGVGVGVEG